MPQGRGPFKPARPHPFGNQKIPQKAGIPETRNPAPPAPKKPSPPPVIGDVPLAVEPDLIEKREEGREAGGIVEPAVGGGGRKGIHFVGLAEEEADVGFGLGIGGIPGLVHADDGAVLDSSTELQAEESGREEGEDEQGRREEGRGGMAERPAVEAAVEPEEEETEPAERGGDDERAQRHDEEKEAVGWEDDVAEAIGRATIERAESPDRQRQLRGK